MQNNWNIYILLVETQNNVIPLENSLVGLAELLMCNSAISRLIINPSKIKNNINRQVLENTQTYVHIYNCMKIFTHFNISNPQLQNLKHTEIWNFVGTQNFQLLKHFWSQVFKLKILNSMQIFQNLKLSESWNTLIPGISADSFIHNQNKNRNHP